MSYAIIKTGGKQFPVEEGQTLRVPTISAEAGKKVDIDTLLVGTSVGAGTIQATVVGHGKDDKVIVFKKKAPQAIQAQARPPSRIYGN